MAEAERGFEKSFAGGGLGKVKADAGMIMRVLFIAAYPHPAYHRKVELLADACDVEILHITLEGYGRSPGNYPSANGKRLYRLKTLPARWLGRSGDPHRGYVWPPHFDMRSFRPDLVHAESDLEALGTGEVSLAHWAFARRSRLIHYSWQNILRPRRRVVEWLAQMNLRAANHIICASSEALDVVRRQGYKGGASVMPLVGLDARYFFPKSVPELRHRLGLGSYVVGFCGRLVPEKGVDTLLRACAQVSPAVHLLIVGAGPERANLEQLSKQLGIYERCHFAGAIGYDAIADFLNVMDVLVLPSRTTTHWKEQFGRVLVEAMGCRTAVLGSDSGAIPEVIGSADLVFPEDDVAALTRRLEQLAQNRARCLEVSERGYRRALANYSVECLAESILKLWRALPYQES